MIMSDLMANPVFGDDDAFCCVNERIEEKDTFLPVENVIYMNLGNTHKIINRFLYEKGMTKDELAGLLDVTAHNIDQLFSRKIPAGLMSKINLPLVKLYCQTKW